MSKLKNHNIFVLSIVLFLFPLRYSAQELWGMTQNGGAENAGTIMSTDSAGGNAAIQYSFRFKLPGNYPRGSLVQATNGKLYGMNYGGGAYDMGLIFSYNPLDSTFNELVTFSGTANGSTPKGSLMQASNGKLYGMTSLGGTSNLGVLFSYDPVTSVYTKLIDFTGNANGSSPRGSLIQASNGKLYGLTYSGGANNKGVLFSYDPATSVYVKLIDYSGVANGDGPNGDLLQATNGKLYGMTYQGGTSNVGTIFSYDPATSIFVKHLDFTIGNGAFPLGSFIQASNGLLYGMTKTGGLGNVGSLFQFNISNSTQAILVNFNGAGNGSNPYGSLIQISNGKLYGMTRIGGANGFGVLFNYDIGTSTYLKLLDFGGSSTGSYPEGALCQASNGRLYGMASYGGIYNWGQIFSFDPVALTDTKIVDLGTSVSGASPMGKLLQATNGKLYGMAIWGGIYDRGVLFCYDPSTAVYSDILNFDGPTNGSYPHGSLIQASDGNIYGMTTTGGTNNLGVLFKFDPATSVYSVLINFDGTAYGSSPWGNLFQASDGKLYGVTQFGGTNNTGAIFSFDPSTSTFTKLFDFNCTTTGCTPYGTLIQASNGNLYGLSAGGGANGNGAIYSFDPVLLTYTTAFSFSIPTGYNPNGNLIQISNGMMYGMTRNGGGSNNGTFFKFDPSTNTYTNLLNLSAVNYGSFPEQSTPVLSNNGKLYSMTYFGGIHNNGVLLEYDPVTNIFVKRQDFYGPVNGTKPSSDMLFICVPPSVLSQSSSLAVCENDPVSLSVNTSGTALQYHWYKNGSLIAGATASTFAIPSASFADAANYSCVIMNGCGYDTSSLITLSVNPSPVVSISATNPTICAMDSTTLTGSGADTYVWNPGSLSGTSVSVAPALSTTYTVIGTNTLGGCSGTASVSVTVNPLPILSVSASDSTICTGDPAILTASGANIYVWMPGSLNGNSVSDSPTASTTYTVTGTDANGCVTTQSISITVNPLPAVTATVSSPVICSGSTITLTGNGAASYSWMPGTLNGSSVSDVPVVSTTYTVTGIDTNSCVNTQSVSVTVNPLPVVSYTETQSLVCINWNPITLSAGSPAGGIYSGSGVAGSQFDPAVAGAGTWDVVYTFTDGNNCSDSITQQVTVDLCLGTDGGVMEDGISVYPNPFNSFVSIISDETKQSQLEVYNVFGEIVFQSKIQNHKTEIDLSKVSSGVYFVTLSNANGTVTQKIIKQ